MASRAGSTATAPFAAPTGTARTARSEDHLHASLGNPVPSKVPFPRSENLSPIPTTKATAKPASRYRPRIRGVNNNQIPSNTMTSAEMAVTSHHVRFRSNSGLRNTPSIASPPRAIVTSGNHGRPRRGEGGQVRSVILINPKRALGGGITQVRYRPGKSGRRSDESGQHVPPQDPRLYQGIIGSHSLRLFSVEVKRRGSSRRRCGGRRRRRLR